MNSGKLQKSVPSMQFKVKISILCFLLQLNLLKYGDTVIFFMVNSVYISKIKANIPPTNHKCMTMLFHDKAWELPVSMNYI